MLPTMCPTRRWTCWCVTHPPHLWPVRNGRLGGESGWPPAERPRPTSSRNRDISPGVPTFFLIGITKLIRCLRDAHRTAPGLARTYPQRELENDPHRPWRCSACVRSDRAGGPNRSDRGPQGPYEDERRSE